MPSQTIPMIGSATLFASKLHLSPFLENNEKLKKIKKIKKNRASSSGDLETLQRLVTNGVNINLSDYDKRTPLHLAATNNDLNMVKFLLANTEIPMGAKDRWGFTAEDEAVRNNFDEISSALRSKAVA